MGLCGADDFDEVGLDREEGVDAGSGKGVDVGGGPESEIEGPLMSLSLRCPSVVLQWFRSVEFSLCVYQIIK